MRFTILLPHYKTGKMTAYALYQLQAMKGRHEIDIIVIDNNWSDGSLAEYVDTPFGNFDNISIHAYPSDKLQSHGIAFDWVIPRIKTEWFITIESDSFPTNDKWLDYYENLIRDGYVAAASVMKLSGGVYGHPCGGLYNKSVYMEALEYVKTIPYKYVPNIAMKENFPCHCMIHEDVWPHFLLSTRDYIDLNPNIDSAECIRHQQRYYLPVATGVFHNGMGGLQEYLSTYGSRTIHTDPPHIILKDHADIIHRMGYEPGQWFWYWMIATGKKIFTIPTMTRWLENRKNQNQEYTLTTNGFKHLWGVSSYHKADIEGMEDVIIFKRNQVEELYNSLPDQYKISSLQNS